MEQQTFLDRGYNTIKHCDKTAKTVLAVLSQLKQTTAASRVVRLGPALTSSAGACRSYSSSSARCEPRERKRERYIGCEERLQNHTRFVSGGGHEIFARLARDPASSRERPIQQLGRSVQLVGALAADDDDVPLSAVVGVGLPRALAVRRDSSHAPTCTHDDPYQLQSQMLTRRQ